MEWIDHERKFTDLLSLVRNMLHFEQLSILCRIVQVVTIYACADDREVWFLIHLLNHLGPLLFLIIDLGWHFLIELEGFPRIARDLENLKPALVVH